MAKARRAGLLGFALLLLASCSGGSGDAPASSPPAVAPPAAPGAPTFSARAATFVTVSWAGAAGATSYRLERADDETGPFVPVAAGLTATSHGDAGLQPGATFWYRAVATNAGGDGAPSPASPVTMDALDPRPPHCPPPGAGAAPAPTASTLVLYDADDPYGWLGESYGIAAGHLASHFGTWEARPVAGYVAGDMGAYGAVVYVGSFFDAPLPDAFLDDVLAGETPVVWLGFNVWQLEARDPAFAARYGFVTGDLDFGDFSAVEYMGRVLTRSLFNADGILVSEVVDPDVATTLAFAIRDDGAELPWALRAGALTYVAENPMSYMTESDRYLAFADLLFDVLAPETPERHRALVRIEDVTPAEDPARLRAIADLLYSLCAPFSVAVVPVYADPLGWYSNGVPEHVLLRESEVADALAYMVARGGELVLHGYTHQYESAINPYSGTSADDFEFWMTYVDEQNRVVYVDPDLADTRHAGPVPTDSATYASDLVFWGLEELAAAGLPDPIAFEYPHYAGSAVDSFTIASIIPTAYHRGFYFPGVLGGPDATIDLTRPFGQLFPYVVNDVYGWRLFPETLGNYEPEAGNAGIPPRFVADLLRNADANWVVRDGFASFFFHPYFEPEILGEIVTGIQQMGYEFVSASSL